MTAKKNESEPQTVLIKSEHIINISDIIRRDIHRAFGVM
jgi:hypothetical protein